MQQQQDIQNELKELSPLLANLSPKHPYTTPEGYFETLPQQLLQQAAQEAPAATSPAKMVTLRRKRLIKRFTIAASVIGIIAIAGWLYFYKNQSTVKEVAIIQQEVEQSSDAELDEFIEDNAVFVLGSNNTSSNNPDTFDIKDMLSDVSDNELQQYLDIYNGKTETLNN